MSADQQSGIAIEAAQRMRQTFQVTGDKWFRIAAEELERHHAALGTALAAMEIASALPAVEAEYDFSHAIKTAWDAYGHDGTKGASASDK